METLKNVFSDEKKRLQETCSGSFSASIFHVCTIYYLLTESEVITGKSQTEALMYCPSDSEVNTLTPRSEISL